MPRHRRAGELPGGSFLQPAAESTASRPAYEYVRSAGCAVDTSDPAAPAGRIEVKIPFTRQTTLGKYVFHRHILEHADHGIMAAIRVLTNEQVAASGAGLHD
ncbi:MAG: hypothetical protein KDG89_09670 [Geminicoccaceae bacterium]|nr:hypothetical protein [Geminicoccaceae bacterium]